nr:SDR family NAD(P)-dependent oxidoreductase [uncultured Cohaesibacter sp.]
MAVFGATGAVGHAIASRLMTHFPASGMVAIGRRAPSLVRDDDDLLDCIGGFDLTDEASIAEVCGAVVAGGMPDLIVVATGILHDEEAFPERSIRELRKDALEHLLAVNLVGPSLILKHLLPHVPRKGSFRMGLLSARVGSISDNHLGGWYSYRASKAGLNMMIKSAAIELKRRNREAVLVGLHPGTVESALSEPFKRNVPDGKLFSPDRSACCLVDVLLSRSAEQSGFCFDWAGKEIEA